MAHGTLQQIVDSRGDEEFIALLVAMNKGLVGVDHLLHVYCLVNIMREACIAIEGLVGLDYLFQRAVGLNHFRSEYAA